MSRPGPTRAGRPPGGRAGRVTRLYQPRPVEVVGGPAPVQVDGVDVVAVREEWLVEDGWWQGADREVRRRYFELVLVDGRALTVFRDCRPGSGRWYSQRA